MRIARACLLVFVVSLAWAEVRGVALAASGRPVANASIRCDGQSAQSGADGSFTVPGVDRCEGTISHPGFETKRIDLVSGGELSISLNVAPLRERVVVSTTRIETTLEEAGVAGTVVTSEDLEQRQFPMIVDVLREIPGLHVAKFGRNGGAAQVFSRGAQRTGTLVLVDGVPVNDPGGDLNFAHLLSGSIERMEVIRGAESALFGAEASAAVIQLFTRRGDAERRLPRVSASYERGSFQTDRWIAGLSGGSGERFDYALNTEQFHTVSEFPNDFYRNTTGALNAGWKVGPATQLRTIFRSFDSSVGVPNRVAYGIFDFDASRQNRDYTASLRLDDVRGRHYVQRVTGGYHRLRDIFSDSRVDGPYVVRALVRDVAAPVRRTYLERLLQPAESVLPLPAGLRLVTSTTRLTASPSVSISSRSNFDYQGTFTHTGGAALFGYEFERQEGVISGRDVERNNHGLFAHKQHTIGGRLFLSGGLRLERNTVFGSKLTPRAAASFRALGEHGSLSATFFRVSAGRGITEPSLLQSFAQTPTFSGNPDLRLEKTTTYDAGVVQEWFGKRLRTEVSAFQNDFRDVIVFLTDTWRNIDRSRARGLECSSQAKFLRYVTASGNYTLLGTRIIHSSTPNSVSTGIGQELIRRPRHSGALSLAIAPRHWFVQTGAVFLGERQDSDNLGVTRNPGYRIVFAGGSYRLNTHVTPFVRADNLLNSRYQEALGYSSLSRSLRGGVRLEW